MRAARDFEYACKFGDPNKLLVVAFAAARRPPTHDGKSASCVTSKDEAYP
jgi:hypothetical protein